MFRLSFTNTVALLNYFFFAPQFCSSSFYTGGAAQEVKFVHPSITVLLEVEILLV